MKNKPFAPGRKPIDEHATKAQPSLRERKIRVPTICTVCRHDRRYHVGVTPVHRDPYWHIVRWKAARIGEGGA